MRTLKEFTTTNTLNEAFCTKADMPFLLITKMNSGNFWINSKHSRLDLAEKALKKAKKTGIYIFTEVIKRK